MASEDFREKVREGNQKLDVDTSSMVDVPFDLAHWQKVAAEKYPNGLPEPESDDPTQWLFHGFPMVPGVEKVAGASSSGEREQSPDQDGPGTLQVAVARLLGYRWPAEVAGASSSGKANQDPEQDAPATFMRLSERARELVKRCDELLPLADKDGIVCLPPVRGEASAADRLLNLLAAAWESGRSFQLRQKPDQDGPATFHDWLNRLLKEAGFEGKTLETWLRDGFFAQHCELFQQRPFVWHIWDGLRDGFAALVNYHRLDRKNLETLIYTYLGDWISRLKVALKVAGASSFRSLSPEQDAPATLNAGASCSRSLSPEQDAPATLNAGASSF
jgi:hypothetical protein